MDAMIRFEGVRKGYGSLRHPVPVLEDFDLTVERSEFLAITGPSGAGKTTLLNLIGGLDLPDVGGVTVADTALNELDPHALTRWRAAHIGFVFQAHHLLPMLDAHDNVELPLLLTRLSRSERKRKAAAALARVGLADKAHLRPGQLSGGQQQRVGIARAVVAGAPILLCDEPTAGLDRAAADDILALLRELSAEGHTVVMVTHDPVAMSAADRRVDLAGAA
jgi:putative ABC transport system ATP-binding protein